MSRFGRNAVAALLGSIVLAGLVSPVSASAATRPAVQVKVCNKTKEALRISAAGLNQHGRWTDVRIRAEVGPGRCYVVPEYHQGRPSTTLWFATNQWVKIFVKNDKVNKDAEYPCHLPKNLRDGSTWTCDVLRAPR